MSVSKNPYSATTTELAASPKLDGRENVRVPWTLLLFPFGCTLGLQVGSMLELGVNATVQRTLTDLQQALTFFACFSVACLGLTFLYRVPRWYVFAPHSIGILASLASGTLMTASFYTATAAYGGRNLVVLCLMGVACIVGAVEFESMIDYLVRRRRERRTAAIHSLPPLT